MTVTITNTRYPSLTEADLVRLDHDYDSIGAIAPSITQGVMAKNGTKTFTATVQGTTANYVDIGGLSLLYGRFLKTPDIMDSSAVAVVGIDVADELFGTRAIIGETISVNSRSFLIVGVLTESESAFGGEDGKNHHPFFTGTADV